MHEEDGVSTKSFRKKHFSLSKWLIQLWSGRSVLTLESTLSFAEVWVFKTPDSLCFSGVWGLSFLHSSFCNTPGFPPQFYKSGHIQHFCLIYCINYALPMQKAFCLQINRNSLFSSFLESSSRLTPHMLKGRTGEFDLESISFLDLSGMGRNKVLIFHNFWTSIFKIHRLKCTVQILVLPSSAFVHHKSTTSFHGLYSYRP